MLQLRTVLARRRPLAATALLVVAGACGGGSNDGSTGVKPAVTTVAVTVPAQIAVASNAGALGLQVVATYDRSSGAAGALGTQTVTVAGSGTQTVPFTIDLSTCLNDATRSGGSSSSTCSVHLQLTLLAGGSAVDAQSVGPYTLTGGTPLTVSPAVVFTQVASVQIVTPTGTVATARTVVGTPLQLTARVLDPSGNVLTGRAVTWSSNAATVATVDAASGLVTPVTVGTTVVSASVAGQTGTLPITVFTANTVAIAGVNGATGTGSVASNPAGLACRIVGGAPSGTSCTSRAFPSDSAVTLTATPDAGTTFGGWGGDCSTAGTNPTCTVTPSAARNATVQFLSAHDRASTLTLTLTDPSGTGGTASLSATGGAADGTVCTLAAGQTTVTCPRSVDFGATVTVTVTRANPSTQTFTFSGDCSGSGTCTLPSVTANKTVGVAFAAAVSLTLNTVGNGGGGGYVTSAPVGAAGAISCHQLGGITIGAACTTQYTAGTQITLTATPDAISTFVAWSGVSCASSGATCVFTIGANGATPVATFAASSSGNGVTIAPTGAGLGGITITTTVTSVACDRNQANRADGGTCIAPWIPYQVPSSGEILTALPASGYHFTKWIGCPAVQSDGTCKVPANGVSAVAAQFDP